MRTIRSLSDLTGKAVLVRAALNVPVQNGKVVNTFRLRRALPTIEYLRKRHARVILIGHLGDQGTETLAPVVEALRTYIPRIEFCPVSTGTVAETAVKNLAPGEVLVLENLRRHQGEKKNDPEFARSLASLADVFVEDSFDVCHREHASVVGVPKLLPSFAGLLVEEEVRELTTALKPKRPSLAIIGGAKFSTKQPLIYKLLGTYDRVFVGGALGNDFIQALGYGVGQSLISHAEPAAVRALLRNKKIAIPLDAVCAIPGAPRSTAKVRELSDIEEDEAILDNGPKTTSFLAEYIGGAKTVLWNGPLGNYENGFIDSTHSLARAIARSKVRSIVGGGDTVAAIESLGLTDRFSFISTGGGAMLDFMSEGTLPGIAVLGHTPKKRGWF